MVNSYLIFGQLVSALIDFVLIVLLIFPLGWEKKWGMAFQPDKCSAMRISRTNGSANGGASASGVGGRGYDPGPCHTKGVKNGTSGYLAWRSAL